MQEAATPLNFQGDSPCHVLAIQVYCEIHVISFYYVNIYMLLKLTLPETLLENWDNFQSETFHVLDYLTQKSDFFSRIRITDIKWRYISYCYCLNAETHFYEQNKPYLLLNIHNKQKCLKTNSNQHFQFV